MSTRRRSSARRTYSPHMDPRPTRRRRSWRPVIGIVLTLLLPPLGLAYMWREGVFKTRGLVVMSCVGTLVMALWIALLLPEKELPQTVPVPAVPASVTVAPDDGTASALSNLDALLAQRQAERDAAAGITPEPTATTSAEFLAEQEAILHTTVYAYAGTGARYYHSRSVCGNQSNFRQLTIEEAMLEQMGPCPDCNPPVYVGP